MIENGKILVGKAEEKSIYLLPALLNRHGLIAGATGTGKTVTLKVIAESLSELGVPTVLADIKGDLSGMIVPGDAAGIRGRLDSMGIGEYAVNRYPVHFFDIYQKKGHPIRASIQDMGVLLLGRILDCTDAQQGVLSIIFKVAKEMELDLIDLKDLQAMAAYVGEHAKDLTLKYGNVTRQSVGAIQRKLLELEEQGGLEFFGMPSLSIHDWMMTEGGYGVMNMIECDELFQHPLLYSTFMLWMLQTLYNSLPEVGDLDRPKLVFFFDEAHLLFDNASRQLMEKIEQTVKLIRSKGVGIFFITQNPIDIPGSVSSQLGNRIQHALRAYTPNEIKAVNMAADSFRANPAFDTSEAITELKTGYALVSALGEDGAPGVVERTKILPPHSSMNIADPSLVEQCIRTDSIYGKYENSFDPQSAYEGLDAIRMDEEQQAREMEEARQAEKIAAKAASARSRQKSWDERIANKARNKLENELLNIGVRQAKRFLKGFLK